MTGMPGPAITGPARERRIAPGLPRSRLRLPRQLCLPCLPRLPRQLRLLPRLRLPPRVRRLAAWAADRESAGPRRRLQIALGVLWLLDAALQYQPYMFSRAFAGSVLAGSAAGSPGLVAGPVGIASRLILHSPAAANAAFATCQLALAAGMLWRPAVRAALAGSIAWSLAIWWLGESLGGVFSATASPVTGAPGAVILYALVALLAWPARDSAGCSAGSRATVPPRGTVSQRAAVADGSPLGGRWSRALWLVLWTSSAYLIVQPPNRAPGALAASIARLASGEPGWIAALDQGAASAAGHAGTLLPVLLGAAFWAVGVAVFFPAAVRPALALAVVLALFVWVVGENFGGLLTGQATDPNTGPLLVLLACAFWPPRGQG